MGVTDVMDAHKKEITDKTVVHDLYGWNGFA